jgi:putative glutathione S-transferase
LLNGHISSNAKAVDLLPVALKAEIEKVNEFYYNKLTNGCYRCGFATSQLAYDEAAADVKGQK